MKRTWLVCILLLAGLLGTSLGQSAQTGGQATQTPDQTTDKTGGQTAPASDQTTERTAGNYVVHQSVEFGYRWTDVTENQSVYNTFVNLQQGPRLLEQSLYLRSRNHEGVLFDEFSAGSFGWGGDPNNALRIRVRKDHWYNLSGSFRRDQNYFDYNLQANPLNPATSNPTIVVTNSPHRFFLRRRMSDINLTLLPQSPVRVRLGYTRNRADGPSFSSFHEGTDVLLFQNWNTTLNAYQIGVDVKPVPRTNISYDQFLQYYKGDTDYALSPFAPFLVGGQSVELGLPWNTPAGQPCRPAAPAPATAALIVNGVLQNPRCSGYFSYTRAHPMRTSYPTEQLTFQTRYFQRVNFAGRVSYSSNKTKVADLAEIFNGLVTRTNERTFSFSGPVNAKRIAVNADAGLTVYLTDRWRLSDSFRFQNFRIPGSWASSEAATFPGRPATGAATPGLLTAPVAVYNLTNCPPPTFNGPNCPQHVSSSPADTTSEVFNRFLGQDAKWNTVSLEYLTARAGVRLGYRLGRRDVRHRVLPGAVVETFLPGGPTITVGGVTLLASQRGGCGADGVLDPATGICTLTEDTEEESDRVDVTEHSALFGVSATPTEQIKLTFDTELMSADHSITRISPRHLQRYKARAVFKPRPWVNLVGTLNLLEARNNVSTVNRREHYRTYGFNFSLTPNERWGLDFGYDYNDIFSATNICFVDAVIPANLVTANIQCGGVPLVAGVSTYDNKTHSFFFNALMRPIPRVALGMGYSVLSADGSTLILNPNQPPGTLDYIFHRPQVSLAFDITKELTFKTAYAYYGYRENQFQGLVQRRNFHANTPLLSLRYAF